MSGKNGFFVKNMRQQTWYTEPLIEFFSKLSITKFRVILALLFPSAAQVPRLNFVPTAEFPALQYFGELEAGGQADLKGIKAGDFILEVSIHPRYCNYMQAFRQTFTRRGRSGFEPWLLHSAFHHPRALKTARDKKVPLVGGDAVPSCVKPQKALMISSSYWSLGL